MEQNNVNNANNRHLKKDIDFYEEAHRKVKEEKARLEKDIDFYEEAHRKLKEEKARLKKQMKNSNKKQKRSLKKDLDFYEEADRKVKESQITLSAAEFQEPGLVSTKIDRESAAKI